MDNIWKHGKYIDLWSLVHFLSGILLASLTYAVELNFSWALVVSVLVMLLWELYESVAKIIEPSANVSVDIVIGLLGFFVASYFYFFLELPFSIGLFILTLTGTLFLSGWGFADFLKRGYR